MKELVLENKNGRADKVLSEVFPEYSRSQIKNLILSGNIKINDKQVKPKYKVSSGDRVTLVAPEIKKLSLEAEKF